VVSGWFVTGTDTGVGKTRAAQALLAASAHAGQRAVGMKPVASGCRATPDGLRSEDAEALIRASNVTATYADVNPYAFAPTISPHLAAREAGVTIQLDVIRKCFMRLADQADYVVVEGAGGWFVPLNDEHAMADVARVLGLSIVLVVGMRLGCLNHALLTQAAIEKSGLAFVGWIANRVDPAMERFDENLATLEKCLHAPLLTVFPHAPTVSPPLVIEKLMKLIINPYTKT
jgi:dethiobiotin synthetase